MAREPILRKKKERYTTYFFPAHVAALKKIAAVSNKNFSQVVAESLDTYLREVGAIDKQETIPARKEDVKRTLESLEGH